MQENPLTVRIQLLGGFRVAVGSRSVGEDGWRLKKARSLIKLLALAPGHRMHRERVMDLLWPDSSSSRSQANNLRQALHSARRALVPDPGASSDYYLRLVGDQVALCPEGHLWVDVEAFEGAAATARRMREPAAYRAAIDLYAGELLPEDRYEEWAQQRREALQATYLSALLELARLREERGEFEEAIEALREAAVAEPTREEAHAGLMRLYALTGRRGEALLQYQRLRETLFEYLGAEPGEAGRRLYEEIRAGRTLTSDPSAARTPTGNGSGGEPSGPVRHNLPVERTSFVGREEALVEVERLLSMTGLLTLTGAGGSGKTRFALALARRLAGAYEDGAWLVELAPLSDPELVERTVAGALGVGEQPGRSLTDTLREHLRSRKLLLVVDNCEHLVEAAARLAETLLGSCPNLKVLATSREALNVSGELVWRVPSLSVPEDGFGGSAVAVEELGRYESVRLFVERATYRRPSFELAPENARAVGEICRRLEGIPLAVELAAARVGVLSVEQISARLKDSLGVLASGSRTAEPRQRTLRGALEWSYELLGGLERDLFCRFSVFQGGWSLEAAEAVGAEGGVRDEDVLDLLGRLVDKSLVVAEAGGVEGELRYRMLEPVRQYGREKLEASGEEDEVGRHHALFFLALAEDVEPESKGQGAWLKRLEAERANLRAASGWALDRDQAGPEEVLEERAATGLRLAVALGQGRFWAANGLSEGLRWLEKGLARSGSALPDPARATALNEAGWIATVQGDQEKALALLEESFALSKKLGDKSGIAASLVQLGQLLTMHERDHARVEALRQEAETLRSASLNPSETAYLVMFLAQAAWDRRDNEQALALFEEGLVLFRDLGNLQGTAFCLGSLGFITLEGDEPARAAPIFEEALRTLETLRDRVGIFHCLLGAASGAHLRGESTRAARLWGAAEGLGETAAVPLIPLIRSRYDYEGHLDTARSRLDEAAWTVAWAEGRAMTPEQAIEYALSAEEETTKKAPTPEEPSADSERGPDALSPREREVAMLVAREMSNRQVAEELVISEHTVATHVHKILKKLDLRSRLQISAWALEQELLR